MQMLEGQLIGEEDLYLISQLGDDVQVRGRASESGLPLPLVLCQGGVHQLHVPREGARGRRNQRRELETLPTGQQIAGGRNGT